MSTYVPVPFPSEFASIAIQISSRLDAGDLALKDRLLEALSGKTAGTPLPQFKTEDITYVAKRTLKASEPGRWALIMKMASQEEVTPEELLRAYEKAAGKEEHSANPHNLAGLLASFTRRVKKEFGEKKIKFENARDLFEMECGVESRNYSMNAAFRPAFLEANKSLQMEGFQGAPDSSCWA